MAGYNNFQAKRNKNYKEKNMFDQERNFNKGVENLTKSEKLMRGVGVWASFYRSNPHRFVKDYLGIDLKLFQKILIFMMNYSFFFMYISSRGQGKSFLTSIFSCVRAILYPETKIIISSRTIKQAREIIEKIDDMRKSSANLEREILELRTAANDARVEFHNGSWIKVVAGNENARGARANVLIVDEFRMVDENVINKVLRKFLTAPRSPKYLNKQKYSHLQERNKEMYLSSAWFKSHWSWGKLKAFFNSMIKGKNYFLAGLPYQLAIKENLLMRDQVEDEMSESDFDEIGFYMEMETLFFGESEKAFFKFEDLEKQRKIPTALYPKHEYDLLKDRKFKYSDKKQGEIRLISCDIAAMGGKENDASVYTIFRLIPNSKGFERHIVYMESMDGGTTDDQSTRIRQMFYDFECDYLVLDTQNMGLGVFDQLTQPDFDKDRNVEYEPWTCINDEKMAERCMYEDAQPIIYSIKGNQALNSECAISFRDGLRRGKIKLLETEAEGRETLNKYKNFDSLPIEKQSSLEQPFMQTTFLINEMVNLESERTDSGFIKLKEPKSKRKDRWSSASYGNYVASILERELLTDEVELDDDDEIVYF